MYYKQVKRERFVYLFEYMLDLKKCFGEMLCNVPFLFKMGDSV